MMDDGDGLNGDEEMEQRNVDPLSSADIPKRGAYDDARSMHQQDRFAMARMHLKKLQATKITDVQYPLLLVAICSAILLTAVCTWQGEVMSKGYALSVPSLSFVLSVVGIVGSQYMQELYKNYGKYLAHVLFLWNFAGASWLTFSGPFTTTGNGYFAAWATVAASATAMGITADAFKDKIQGLGSLMGCCGSSIILALSSMEYVSNNAPPETRGSAVYAMALSVLTVALIACIMFLKKRGFGAGNSVEYETKKFYVLGLYSFLWFVCACRVTFHGPFVTTGNGYFSAWAGSVCIAYATLTAKKEIGVTTDEVINGGGVGENGGTANSDNDNIPTDLSDDI